ncbi:HPP family protein [Calothrix sp. NIES-4071]|nr:HPP family protein [Calothrix sp. NIES-4071]BAZ57170.1 HPP family protein [Calothrix sp. NIES-4105]
MKKFPQQKPDNTFQLIWIHLKENILKLCRSSVNQPNFSPRQILLSGVGSFLGIAVLVYLTLHTRYPLIAAPFGASAVLLYAVPESPLAQPRNVIGGNILGALTCITLVHLFGDAPWVQAASVAIAIKLMQLTKTLHPPGGAVALVGAMSNASWGFLFTPVLAGSVIILFCTYTFNKFVATKAYSVN